MSETSLLWVLGSLVAMQAGVCMALYNHVRECKSTSAKLADHAARIRNLEKEDER